MYILYRIRRFIINYFNEFQHQIESIIFFSKSFKKRMLLYQSRRSISQHQIVDLNSDSQEMNAT